ncbi:MAG: hypothetical protein SFX73_32200 [Kofleriaceae bacterium]|nr:hypothetical protein [Kofleriaceae bacterium]
MISARVVRTLGLAAVLAIMGRSTSARAGETEDVQEFIAGRPELASITSKAVTRVGDGTYRVELGSGPSRLFIVKAGGRWAAALTVAPKMFDLGALIPGAVLGDAKVSDCLLVIAGGSGTIDGAPLGIKELGKPPVVAGANLMMQLAVGTRGTLGQLAGAGVLPNTPMWITGTLGGGAVESLLAGKTPSLGAVDFSLAIQVPSFTPAPFSVIESPKLSFGDSRFTFVRSGGAFTLSGEQTNSKVRFGQRTISIPRTRLAFAAAGDGGYDIAVEGWSTEPWREAFGLSKVDLKAVGLVGTISSRPARAGASPIKGFGLGLAARIAINKREYEGQFSILVDNNKLKELSLALAGDLNLDFLPGGKDFTFKQFELAFTPGSQQVAIAGELQWRSLTGRAAVVMSKEPFLLLGLTGFDLGVLVGPGGAGLKLPTLDVLLTAGFAANSGDVTNLPRVAQALVDEFAGANSKVKIANGLGLVTRADAKMLGVDRLGVTGALSLAGSVDLLKGSFRLAASLPSMPKIPGLPAGFGVEDPEVFVAVDRKAGAPVASSGLGLRLLFLADKQPLAFKGSLAVSTAGTLSFTGAMETNWTHPFGLDGLTILAPVVVTVGVGADASVDLGIQAGMSIAKQTYNPMAMCVNLQAAAPAPIPKKLAIKFKGAELGPKVQLEILEALVKSVVNGPLKNATLDPATQKALVAIKPRIDKIGDSADGLGIAAFSLKDVDFGLTTPGVTCDLPAISGMGIKVAGSATYMGKQLGKLDSFATLTEGFKLDAKIANIELFNLIKLTNARLDVLSPMPGLAPPRSAADTARADKLKSRLAKLEKELTATNKAIKKERDADDKAELVDDRDDLEKDIAKLEKDIQRASGPDPGHFYLSGKTELMGSSSSVNVTIDKLGAEFSFAAELADLGKLSLTATTEGEDITKVNDFTIGLGVSNVSDKLMKKLGTALKASAATRKQLQGDFTKGTDAAIKSAQADFDRLDASTGKDYRSAKRALKKAKKKLKRARRSIDKAKDKCEEDLGVAASLCGAIDAAKETLKLAKHGVNRSEDTLEAIKKSSDYLRMKTLKATIAMLKAGKDLAASGLAGWAAVDSVGQMLLDGTASGLIEVDEIELAGSLRKLRGTLDLTIAVGETDIEKSYELALGPGALDVTDLAEDIADEITEQATKKDSEVWKLLRKRKK